jgi:sugar phosphate permease
VTSDLAAEGSAPVDPAPVMPPRETRGTALNATLIVVAQSTQAIAVGAIALFLPLIRADLGLSFAQAGLLAAVATLSYALMQVPAGILSDRMSPKVLFGVGLIGTNALAIVFALSDSYSVMLVTQGVAGVFRALMFIPGMLLITRHFSEAKRATAMGLFVAGGFSSNIVVNLLGPILVGPLGWQWIIALSSMLGLVVTAAFWLLGDDGPPRDHGDSSRAATGWVWRTRAWWLLGVIQFSRLSIVAGVGFWVPAFLIEERGFELAAAGLVVALSAAITAPANIGGGILSDRLQRPMLVIGVALGSLTVLLALIGVVTLSPVLVALILLTALVIQVYFGPLFAVPRTLFGPGLAGLSSGFGNFCANVGGFASVLLLGVLKDATGGFGVGFVVLAGLALVGFLAVLLLTKSTPRATPG